MLLRGRLNMPELALVLFLFIRHFSIHFLQPTDVELCLIPLFGMPQGRLFHVLAKKYQDANSIAASHAINIPLLRYADVLLIASEAEARVNGGSALAYNYINQVRARAGLPNLQAGLSKDAFINALLQERSWEFFAEGDRWHDLTRTNTFLTVIPKAINEVYSVRTPLPKHRFFPIPQDEINANSAIEQNPDWK
jgi:starch-binding outer membrane protein, SusD/RagB family